MWKNENILFILVAIVLIYVILNVFKVNYLSDADKVFNLCDTEIYSIEYSRSGYKIGIIDIDMKKKFIDIINNSKYISFARPPKMISALFIVNYKNSDKLFLRVTPTGDPYTSIYFREHEWRSSDLFNFLEIIESLTVWREGAGRVVGGVSFFLLDNGEGSPEIGVEKYTSAVQPLSENENGDVKSDETPSPQ